MVFEEAVVENLVCRWVAVAKSAFRFGNSALGRRLEARLERGYRRQVPPRS